MLYVLMLCYLLEVVHDLALLEALGLVHADLRLELPNHRRVEPHDVRLLPCMCICICMCVYTYMIIVALRRTIPRTYILSRSYMQWHIHIYEHILSTYVFVHRTPTPVPVPVPVATPVPTCLSRSRSLALSLSLCLSLYIHI